MSSTFAASYPCRARSATSARRALVAHLQSTGLSGLALADLECAVGEALANAIEHGSAFKGRLHVRCVVDSDQIVIEIEDSGNGFDPKKLALALEPDDCRGRGIYLMSSLVDDLNYENGGAAVRLVMRRNGTV